MSARVLTVALPSFTVSLLAASTSAIAQNESSPALTETVIVGTSDSAAAGSLHLVKAKQLERQEYDDAQAVVQQVPGVYSRNEDGVGLRPNIGIRGANSDRSKKITLMEDGILFGPAPYSAPAAYYFPLVTRMQTVRVLKGPSAVLYGPNTVGGAIDFVTRDIPPQWQGGIDVAGGERFYGKIHAYAGGSAAGFGALVEGVHLRNDGFKLLDGGGNTGAIRNEWMAKISREVGAPEGWRQKLRLKLGYSDETSHETYLGLTDEDARSQPNRRYAASAGDLMQWHRTMVVATHQLESEVFSISTSVYRHDFDRSWNKLNGFAGTDISDVLAAPGDARNAQYVAILRGQLTTTSENDLLRIGPNHRTFVSQGVQSIARGQFDTGPVRHAIEGGVRWHFDSIERLHTEQLYALEDGRLIVQPRPTTTTAANAESTHAVAVHAADTMRWGRLALTPGVRLELMSGFSRDELAHTSSTGFVSVVLPGIGVHVDATDFLGVFAGVHRGFSPPPPSQYRTATPEDSINAEGGARLRTPWFNAEAIGFFNRYSNLTNLCTFSGGCPNAQTDRQTDLGLANIWGLEAFTEKELRVGAFTVPWTIAYTWTNTEMLTTFTSSDPQYGRVQAGDHLPYVPEHQLAATLGLEHRYARATATGTYVSAMRESAGHLGPAQSAWTDPLFTLDLGVSVAPVTNLQIYFNVRNVLNTQVITSRRPFGARPNAPRWIQAGVKWAF